MKLYIATNNHTFNQNSQTLCHQMRRAPRIFKDKLMELRASKHTCYHTCRMLSQIRNSIKEILYTITGRWKHVLTKVCLVLKSQ